VHFTIADCKRKVHAQVRRDASQADELKDDAAHQPREHLQRKRRQPDERDKTDQPELRRGENRRAGRHQHQREDGREHLAQLLPAPPQQPRDMRHGLDDAAVSAAITICIKR
jgi:hypothetical protein